MGLLISIPYNDFNESYLSMLKLEIYSLMVDIRHHRVLLKKVPEQITGDQRMVTNLLLK